MTELKELGKPKFFDVEKCLDVVEDFINADEVERALWILDNLPGYYRDHTPERAKEIKASLHRQLWTPVQYQGIYDAKIADGKWVLENSWPHRAQILADIIFKLNQENKTPHVMELAPGNFWLTSGLMALNLKFTYSCLSVDQLKPPFPSEPTGDEKIFVCFELIEHLSNEYEIYQNYQKFGVTSDYVLISTPLYTSMGGLDGWKTRPLGHLRTYTPKELHDVCVKMFEGYTWEVGLLETITMIGRKK